MAPHVEAGSYRFRFTNACISRVGSSVKNDSPKTFTMERGDASLGQRVPYGIFNSLTVTITRQDCTVSGNILGQAVTDPFTLTSSPTLTSSQVCRTSGVRKRDGLP